MKRPCAHFHAGECPYTGGRCRDGMPDPCPLWKSLAKRTAARIRWAHARRGQGRIGRTSKEGK